MASLLPLYPQYFRPSEGRSGPPTFTGSLLRHAVLSDPEEATRLLPIVKTVVLSSDKLTRLPQLEATNNTNPLIYRHWG